MQQTQSCHLSFHSPPQSQYLYPATQNPHIPSIVRSPVDITQIPTHNTTKQASTSFYPFQHPHRPENQAGYTTPPVNPATKEDKVVDESIPDEIGLENSKKVNIIYRSP